MTEKTKTNRGFIKYPEIEDDRGIIIRAQESSAVGPMRLWLFIDDPKNVYKGEPSPHIGAKQAEQLIDVLQAFVDEARSSDNWRNDPEYVEAWGGEES